MDVVDRHLPDAKRHAVIVALRRHGARTDLVIDALALVRALGIKQ